MISFAIIGFGNIGKRHAQHIVHHPDASLAGICDVNSSLQNQALQMSPTFYTDVETMLREVRADVINICTPNYLHAAHTVSSLNAGFHCIVEKPMALSTEECDRMIAASHQSGKIIFAVKQNRYNPPVQLVHRLMQEGTLGKIIIVQVNCFWNRNDFYYAQSDWRGRKDMDGGCLFTQFSHFVDILYYLVGDMRVLNGAIDNYLHRDNTQFEDTGVFTLRSQTGALISFNFTTCSFEKNMEGSITLIGEKGTVKIGGQYLNTIEYSHILNNTLPSINIHAKENDYGSYKGSMSNHDKVIQNTIDVLEHGHPIMTSAQEGREVVRIIEEMYQVIDK